MNVAEQNVFFDLLRYSLWGSKINYDLWRGDWEWSAILKAIDEQALATLMLEAVLALPEDLQPKEDEVVRLSKQMGANMLRHGSLNKDLIEIFKVLESKGLHPVLLKGQGNATFYRKPLLRKCGDLDIYIGIENFEEASVALRSCSPNRYKEILDYEKHAVFIFGKTDVELHRFAGIQHFPFPDKQFQTISKRELARPDFVQIEGHDIAIPPAQFDALFVFNHLWGHVRSCGVGLRQFCDLAMVLHQTKDKIDMQVLEDDLRNMKMMEEWCLVGNALVRYLGMPESEYPFYVRMDDKKVEAFMRLVFSDGNFGCNNKGDIERLGYYHRKFHILLYELERGLRMTSISMPMALHNVVYRMAHGVRAIWEKK